MKRLLSLLLMIMSIGLFAACSSDDLPKTQPGENVKTSSSTQDASSDAGDRSVLGEIEVIARDDGTKIARSETGVEVEVSTESFEELYDEYEAVAGTGSEKEKELLSKIQLILESQME